MNEIKNGYQPTGTYKNGKLVTPQNPPCENMTDTLEQNKVVSLDYAVAQDIVLVEFHPRKYRRRDMLPAKVIEVENGYEIATPGVLCYGIFRLSKESYGKSWRCWEIKKPTLSERNSIPWK